MSNTGMENSDDERMRALFHDAVSEVEPRDGLAEVRRRTRARRTSTSRRWLPVLVGAGAVGGHRRGRDVRRQRAGRRRSRRHHGRELVEPGARRTTRSPGRPASTSSPTPPTGPRLFREFQAVGADHGPGAEGAARAPAVDRDAPNDPDYETLWPAGSFSAVTVEDDRIVVELGTEEALLPTDTTRGSATACSRPSTRPRPRSARRCRSRSSGTAQPAREVLGFQVGAQVEARHVVHPGRSGQHLRSVRAAGGRGRHLRRQRHDGDRTSAMSSGPCSRTARSSHAGGTAPVDITGPDARATLGAPGWETEEIDVSDLAPGNYEFVVIGHGHGPDLGPARGIQRHADHQHPLTSHHQEDRTMKRHAFPLAVTATLAALVLSGCGDDDEPTNADDPASTPASETSDAGTPTEAPRPPPRSRARPRPPTRSRRR